MFWSRSAVSPDMRQWVLECFDWFDRHFTPPKGPILPTKEFFTAPGGTGGGKGPAAAQGVLADICRHLDYTGPVELAELETLPAEYRHSYQSMGEINGMFMSDGKVAVIQYQPQDMGKPIQFINTMAHEMMHARLHHYVDDVPGGAEAHELATDLGCIIAGYGTFQLQAADDMGWSGYLSQPTRAYALAMFLDRRGMGLDAVTPHLSGRCRKYLKRAFKEIN